MKTPIPFPKPKPRRNRVAVTLHILRSRYDVFALASEEIERRTGTALGVEAMMEYGPGSALESRIFLMVGRLAPVSAAGRVGRCGRIGSRG